MKVAPADLADPGKGLPLVHRLALLARHLPKGSGRLSQFLGRKFLKGACYATRTPTGALLQVVPEFLDYYIVAVKPGSGVTRTIVSLCRGLTRPGDVFMDIGANAGYVSMEVAHAHGGRLEVVSFEPLPVLARAVAASAAINGFTSTRVYQCCLGAEAGEVELHLPTHAIHASLVARERGARVVKVPLVLLDDLVAAGVVPPPTVIKLDVEGAERQVLLGARETLRRHQPLVLFEADENMARFGHGTKDLVEVFRAAAPYRFLLVEWGGVLRPLDDGQLADARGDLLAVPVEGELGSRITPFLAR